MLLIVSGVVLAQGPRQRRPVNPRALFDENDPPTFSRELDFDGEIAPLEPRNNKKSPNKPARVRGRPSSNEDDEEEVEAKPVVQTIRRYSVENEDGTFTFGYENADGTYKEETRGSDCVVRGKYGYVDPDGVKREFAYETGNPCVPGEKNEDEEEEPVNFRPANPQRRPVKANAPEPVAVKEKRPLAAQRPTTTMRPLTEEDDGETLFVPNRAPVAPNRARTRPAFDEEEAAPVEALNTKAKEALSALRNRKQESAEKQQQQRPAVVPRVNEPARSPASRRPTESTIDLEGELARLTDSSPSRAEQTVPQSPDGELDRRPQRRRPVRPRQRALFIEDN